MFYGVFCCLSLTSESQGKAKKRQSSVTKSLLKIRPQK